jgi:hypothetical protein
VFISFRTLACRPTYSLKMVDPFLRVSGVVREDHKASTERLACGAFAIESCDRSRNVFPKVVWDSYIGLEVRVFNAVLRLDGPTRS